MSIGSNTRDKLRETLLRLWPKQNCFDCGRTPEQCGTEYHEIHHINGDDADHRLANIIWACHGCNHKLEYRKIKLQGREFTPEQKKSEERKPVFYKWLWDRIQQANYHTDFEDGINSGAYIFGVDIVTIRRWMKPLMSSAGPYKLIAFGKLGETHIAMKGKSFSLEEEF